YDGEHVFALGERGFGVDIDSPNYTLIPGSSLADGGSYREAPSSRKVVPAPAWFYDLLRRRADRAEQPQDPVVDLDKPEHVAWAINYLKNHAPVSKQGSNGDNTVLQVAGVLKDHGISEDMALALMAEHYNDRCEPPWSIGEGADADRLDVKVRNAYAYLRDKAPGEDTAEAHFATDPVSPSDQQQASAPPRPRVVL